MFQGSCITVTRLESDFAHLCFDNQQASVNKFDQATLSELACAIEAIAASDVKGLVCSSNKSSFIVGADIGEFAGLFSGSKEALGQWCQRSNAIFNALESLEIPTVSLVDGAALGGGFEFCLATDYRVATQSAVFGFPEVGLGICPGFGGTVRAPRVMEPEKAVQWISLGSHNSAEQALSDGAIDTLAAVDNLFELGIDLLEQALAHPVEFAQLRKHKANALERHETTDDYIMAATVKLEKDPRNHNPAPLRVLSLLKSSIYQNAAAALAAEQAAFVDLARSEVAGNLIQVFTNDQWLRNKSRELQKSAHETSRSAVLGAGIMGGGIAYQSALRGVPIIMKDIAQEGLDAGINEASGLLDKQVAKGRLYQDKAEKILTSIKPSLTYEGFDDVDVVIEAVVENAKVKKAVLSETEKVIDSKAILASNTSTISITALAQGLARPEKFCGMHFFNPVPLMPLVEVIRGEKTSDETIASTVAFASRLGKTPIVVNDCPGFLVNRILFPYFGAFSALLRDGADYLEIDAAMEAFGWPMGPAYLLDVVGMDTAVHAQAVMAEGFPERMDYGFKSAMDILFEAGHLGQKTGAGFYKYVPGKGGRLQKEIDTAQGALVAKAKHSSNAFNREIIVQRLMVALCLETVRCLEDGIVSSPIEADMGLILGLGFPRFRGGALRYIDSMGLPSFCDLADSFADLGPLYTPTQKMREMARKGERYYA
ncbi:MAG: fatty acid oxidation complex subunit alpha FadB [Pseudohongiellaceae bacterium]|nr:fatty acid oxidation complex subunit alpha FadB [Pseudohongiellaceae bacterium]